MKLELKMMADQAETFERLGREAIELGNAHAAEIMAKSSCDWLIAIAIAERLDGISKSVELLNLSTRSVGKRLEEISDTITASGVLISNRLDLYLERTEELAKLLASWAAEPKS